MKHTDQHFYPKTCTQNKIKINKLDFWKPIGSSFASLENAGLNSKRVFNISLQLIRLSIYSAIFISIKKTVTRSCRCVSREVLQSQTPYFLHTRPWKPVGKIRCAQRERETKKTAPAAAISGIKSVLDKHISGATAYASLRYSLLTRRRRRRRRESAGLSTGLKGVRHPRDVEVIPPRRQLVLYIYVLRRIYRRGRKFAFLLQYTV